MAVSMKCPRCGNKLHMEAFAQKKVGRSTNIYTKHQVICYDCGYGFILPIYEKEPPNDTTPTST